MAHQVAMGASQVVMTNKLAAMVDSLVDMEVEVITTLAVAHMVRVEVTEEHQEVVEDMDLVVEAAVVLEEEVGTHTNTGIN